MRCLICNSENKFEVIRKKLRLNVKRDVLKCRQCGFVFLKPLGGMQKFYQSKSYRKLYGPDLNKLKKSSAKPQEIFNAYYPFQGDIIKEIKHILKPNMKVLDVGCSTGHFLAALKGKVKTRVGVEFSQNEVNFIKRNLDFKVYNEPIENLEMPEGPFDLVTAFQVLEHVSDPLSFVKNLGKKLKKGGYLYLELPNINDPLLWYYQVPGYADFYYREPHLSYFSVSTLKKLLAKAGFKGEIKTAQRYNILNHLNWILTDKPQGNFSLGNSNPVLVKAKNVNPKAKKELNDFIKRADAEYKKIINQNYLGESLTFLGKKIKS